MAEGEDVSYWEVTKRKECGRQRDKAQGESYESVEKGCRRKGRKGEQMIL